VAENASPAAPGAGDEPTRRDFIYIATGAVGAVGAAAFVWPLVSQMSPAADTLALASTEYDLSQVPDLLARQAGLHPSPQPGGNRRGAP
jgi:Rieske Fe-S protein